MKHPVRSRRILSVLLCCLLLAGAFAAPAGAAPPPSASQLEDSSALLEGPGTSEAPPAPGEPDEPEEAIPPEGAESPEGPGETAPPEGPGSSEEPGETPSPENPEEPDAPSPSPSVSPSPSPSPTPTPSGKSCTVTFHMGRFGTRRIILGEGRTLPQAPEIPQLPCAQVLGWFDQDGQLADPCAAPVTEDLVYTARWTRHLSELLDTDHHDAYINGYTNGMFKPGNNVLRCEAVQLLYGLLRAPTGETAGFPDVSPADWFAKAVDELYAYGVIRGGSDGNFNPNRTITRAEFVTMAVACDSLAEDGSVPFSDVPASHWAWKQIATAYSRGWISGYTDGTFHPDSPITRGEAVVVINKMLGRTPDANVKSLQNVKNFYDVFPDSWVYAHIAEASTTHTYQRRDSREAWESYEQDTAPVSGHWLTDGGNRYYVDPTTRKFLRGPQTVAGKKYLFDSVTGATVTGFHMEGSWKRYYKDGSLMEDLSGLGVVSGPYFIKVYKPANYLIIFGREGGSGPYNIPVRAMRVSCGYGTPTGTYYTPDRYRWLQMVGNTWAQWCTQITGNYLFHSVPNWTYDNFDLEVDEWNLLGETRSLGCIRLNCRDAKWIYDNCVLGTEVYISSWEAGGPLPKPGGGWIPSWHTWDPTDPTAYWKCQEIGCH